MNEALGTLQDLDGDMHLALPSLLNGMMCGLLFEVPRQLNICKIGTYCPRLFLCKQLLLQKILLCLRYAQVAFIPQSGFLPKDESPCPWEDGFGSKLLDLRSSDIRVMETDSEDLRRRS